MWDLLWSKQSVLTRHEPWLSSSSVLLQTGHCLSLLTQEQVPGQATLKHAFRNREGGTQTRAATPQPRSTTGNFKPLNPETELSVSCKGTLQRSVFKSTTGSRTTREHTMVRKRAGETPWQVLPHSPLSRCITMCFYLTWLTPAAVITQPLFPKRKRFLWLIPYRP